MIVEGAEVGLGEIVIWNISASWNFMEMFDISSRTELCGLFKYSIGWHTALFFIAPGANCHNSMCHLSIFQCKFVHRRWPLDPPLYSYLKWTFYVHFRTWVGKVHAKFQVQIWTRTGTNKVQEILWFLPLFESHWFNLEIDVSRPPETLSSPLTPRHVRTNWDFPNISLVGTYHFFSLHQRTNTLKTRYKRFYKVFVFCVTLVQLWNWHISAPRNFIKSIDTSPHLDQLGLSKSTIGWHIALFLVAPGDKYLNSVWYLSITQCKSVHSRWPLDTPQTQIWNGHFLSIFGQG